MRNFTILFLFFIPSLMFAQKAVNYYERGVIKYNKFDYKEAIRLLDSAIILNPRYSEAYNARGLAKGYIQDYTGAIADYNLAIEINPEFGIAYHNRGISKNNNGDKQGACSDWNKALGMKVEGVQVLISMFCRDINQ